MKTAHARLQSVSPYSQNKKVSAEKKPKESADDYERRTWRERCHVNEDGFIVIPPMVWKNCLSEAAKYLSRQIPGKGKSTYTKHFEAGVLVTEPVALPVLKADVPGEWISVPPDGRRGGERRVDKCFPVIAHWEAVVTFYVLDDTITAEVFEEHLREAGRFIGVGRFRPRRNGYYGRFEIKEIQWDLSEA